MATKNPRLQVMLEPLLFDAVSRLADEEGVSMSTKARDLIKEGLEHLEDMVLLSLAEERAAHPGKMIPLREVRKRLGV